jgi:hypothetical protein
MSRILDLVEVLLGEQHVAIRNQVPRLDQIMIGRVLSEDGRLDLGVKLLDVAPLVVEAIEMSRVSGGQPHLSRRVIESIHQSFVASVHPANAENDLLKVVDGPAILIG